MRNNIARAHRDSRSSDEADQDRFLNIFHYYSLMRWMWEWERAKESKITQWYLWTVVTVTGWNELEGVSSQVSEWPVKTAKLNEGNHQGFNHHNSISMRLNSRKCFSPRFHSSPWNGSPWRSGGSAQTWGSSHWWRSPEQKAPIILWTQGSRNSEGRARNEKVLNTESEWGKISLRFTPFLSIKRSW